MASFRGILNPNSVPFNELTPRTTGTQRIQRDLFDKYPLKKLHTERHLLCILGVRSCEEFIRVDVSVTENINTTHGISACNLYLF